MSVHEPFDPLERFAEIEGLVGKVYFRFSHLFLDRDDLRDFWWEMAREEEQHACILHACKALIVNYHNEKIDASLTAEKAAELKKRLNVFLSRGASSLSVEEAFRIAVDIESSEIDAIYSKLLKLGGPEIAKTMENLGVPASVQRHKLKAALRQFCATSPELVQAAERL
jgi:rubrerythrin